MKYLILILALFLLGCNDEHDNRLFQDLGTGKIYSLKEGVGDTYFIKEVPEEHIKIMKDLK